MLSPKRTKFRKQFKGRIHGPAKAGTSLNFGAYGLKALEPERLTAREIEAARRAITREMKRAGRVWIRIFPDVPVSKKPAEVRMGSGKGAPEYWVAKVKPLISSIRAIRLRQRQRRTLRTVIGLVWIPPISAEFARPGTRCRSFPLPICC